MITEENENHPNTLKTIIFSKLPKNINKIPKTREFILQHLQLSEHLVPFDLQWKYLLFLISEMEDKDKDKDKKDKDEDSEELFEKNTCKYIKQEIKKKINSYRHQDLKKNVYDISDFIDYPFLLKKMVETKMKCFYCECNLFVLYDLVREKYQWTIDRINNQKGHVKSNFVLSCFACNIKRRCQQLEKFYFTKNLLLKKI